MQIREFAERILFGTSFEDKLIAPMDLQDDRRGQTILPPSLPGRPEELRLDVRRPRVAFPGVHDLDRPKVRGQVLHFFANHELLATELMALCLLRFPEAPASFRRGLVETIFEEQEHLRLYQQRMEEAGVALGEIPVNAFFWNCLSGMDDPIDFVTGMSLTFEQANLDYSRFYADAFRVAGDLDTADVLDRVYEDEIGHVKHGVVWFERWRDPEQSPFDAYAEQLREPLSPARARGRTFDREGRRRAGLSEDFIRHIEVFGAPKGRPPAVWLANLSCEHCWIHGDGHPLPQSAAALEQDLQTLPIFLAAEDDVVVVREAPDPDFLTPIVRSGFPAPAFALAPDESAPIEVAQRHLGELRPWGWSPDAGRRMQSLADRLVHPGRPPAERVACARSLNRKSWDLPLLTSFLAAQDDTRLSATHTVGIVCREVGEAMRRAEQLLSREVQVLAKADRGTSGRGHRRILKGDELPEFERWLVNSLRHHDAVVVEPLLDVCANFSIVGHLDAAGVFRSDGLTRFLTDERGQYLGALLGQPNEGLCPALLRFRHGDGRDPRFLARTLEACAHHVAANLHTQGYVGPFGIDAFVHRENERLFLRPLVETNVRYTMGHVATALDRRLAGGTTGLWVLLRRADIDDPDGFASRLAENAPLRYRTRRADAQIAEGALFTTDPAVARQVFSLLLAGPSIGRMAATLRAAGAREKAVDRILRASGSGTAHLPSI